jgi:TRAP-type C4-dicarboxylate transport system permease small subunit
VNGRRVTATVIGALAGAAGFLVLLLAGWLLYRRLWGDSVTALGVIVVLFGAAGLYAGWLLGVIVFSALRGPDGDEGTPA